MDALNPALSTMDLVLELTARGRTVLFYRQQHGSELRAIVRNGMGGHDYEGNAKGLQRALAEIQAGCTR